MATAIQPGAFQGLHAVAPTPSSPTITVAAVAGSVCGRVWQRLRQRLAASVSSVAVIRSQIHSQWRLKAPLVQRQPREPCGGSRDRIRPPSAGQAPRAEFPSCTGHAAVQAPLVATREMGHLGGCWTVVTDLVERGRRLTTVRTCLGPGTTETLRQALEKQDSSPQPRQARALRLQLIAAGRWKRPLR